MFELRYYQQEALAAVYREFETRQATAIVAATGTGKTEMYLNLAVEVPGRVLVVAHRDYLLTQPIERLEKRGYDDVAVEKAEEYSERQLRKAKIVFATIQSISKDRRLKNFDPREFDLVIIDEGHRGVARTYRKVIDHFCQNPDLRVLILTATPKRKDGVALNNLCGGDISVAYCYPPKRAAEEGWLVPLRFYRREVKDLDFSHVKYNRAKGDLDPDQVEQLLLQERPLHDVCASLAEDKGATLVFCPGVKIAQAYAHLMNDRYRPGRAVAMWADTDAAERARLGKAMTQGELDYVFNVDIATEGYDVPELARVVWAAPTASLVRFTQGTGRVFRPHAAIKSRLTGGREDAESRRLAIAQSPKPFGHVVTYYPQNCRHQLCEPNDILGGDELRPEIRGAAKQIQEATAAQEQGSDPEEDVETAEAYVALRELLHQNRRGITAKAKVEDIEYDGMGGSRNRMRGQGAEEKTKAVKAISNDWPPGDPASPKQIAWLKRHGVPNAAELRLTKWRAVVVRELMEKGKFSPDNALSVGKKQWFTIKKKLEAKVTAGGTGDDF